MRTYAEMKAFIEGVAGVPTKVVFSPGPKLPDTPGRYIVLTRYGGPGENLEGAMDSISWQVRVAGLQNNYDDAESIADVIDVALLGINTAQVAGVHGVERVGGAPTALLLDDADRTNFVCSYNINTVLALAN